MTKKYFGTDGIRGHVGETPITPEFVMHLGYSAGKVLAAADWHLSKGERPAVLIGKDTRISGYMLESALQAGLSAAGVDVLLSGPTPTPAVAYLTRALRLQAVSLFRLRITRLKITASSSFPHRVPSFPTLSSMK